MSHKELRQESERNHSAKMSRMIGHADKAADEKMIRTAINEHDEQMHGGKKTRLKFADGGSVEDKPKVRRDKRASGGAAKHKGAHVNVIVAPQVHPGMMMPGGPPTPAPMMPPPPHPMPAPMPAPGGAPGGMAGGPPIGAMAPHVMPPQPIGAAVGMPPRKRGGKVSVIDDGAGGGEGRLEKIKAYGKNSDMDEDDE